ncbi:MAG: hypothetical protein RL020_1766 [Pseudomonadota bacterium]|jgi:diguanylate cyclase (GGDEF)-like protein
MNSNPTTTSVDVEQASQGSLQLARIPLRRIGRGQGLPSGQVHHLVQDAQGVFWMATPGGLASYDGSSVRTFTRNDGLGTQGLRTLAVTADGRVWIGSDVGVDIVEPDGRIHSLVPDWAFGLVEQITVGENSIWLATARGLVLYDLASNAILRADDFRLANALVTGLEFDRAGRLWASGPQFGLLCREEGRWRSPQNWDWTKAGLIQTIAPGPDDTLLIGGENGIVQIRPDGSLVRSFLPEKPQGGVTALLWADDLLWAGIGSQFVRFKSEEKDWRIFDMVLPDNIINSLYADNHGNIWGASDTSGVFKISALRHAVRRPRIDSIGAVFSLREKGEGNFLLGGERGAARLSLRRPDRVQPIEGLRHFKVWDILESATGQIWAATQQGLYTFIGRDTPRRIGTDHSVLSAPARVLHERGNSVWIGTLRGLARTVAGDAVEVLTERGQPLGYVYSILEDRLGNLWIGTLGNGLWRESPSGFVQVVESGMSATANVYGITEHTDGRIAFLHDAKIFLRQPTGEINELVESTDSLAGWSIKFGPDNTLYVGSAGGLRLYDSISGELKREITSWMGVGGWEFTTSRSLALVAPGLMLCGVNSGLTIVDLREYEKFSAAPTVRLRKQTWNNAKVDQEGSFATVDYGKWTVEFSLFTGWFLDEEDVRVRVRMLGFDTAWSTPMSISAVQYNSLPVGKYTFEAQAYSPLTGWGPLQRLLTINVRAQWRQFGFANLMSVMGLSRINLASASKRNEKLKQTNVELEQRVRDRTIEVESVNQELQRVNRELERVSFTDSLTNVSNRRAFDDLLIREFRRAKRTGLPLSLILLDIDSFKAYNDNYGHQQGDTALKRVAQVLEETLRDAGDVVARYGGEEFAVLLPETDAAGAESVTERLRAAVEAMHVLHEHALVGKVITVSAGIGTLVLREESSISELVSLADQALYRAKRNGRNRWARGAS